MYKSTRSKIKQLSQTSDGNFIEVIRHTFGALFILLFATLAQFLFDVVLSRNFGAYGAGLFYLALSVLMVLSLVGRVGLDQAVVRFIPPVLKKNPEQAHGVYQSATWLSLMLSIPLGLGLFLLAPILGDKVFSAPDIVFHLRVFALIIPIFSLNYIYSGVLKSLKRSRQALSVERLTIYLFGIIGVVTLGQVYGLRGVTIGFALSILLSMIMGAYYIYRAMPKISAAISQFSKRRLFATATPLLFVAFATQLSGQASSLLLGVFARPDDVGIFNISLKISMLMTLILTAVNVIAATKISELFGLRKHSALALLLSKLSALGTALAVPLYLFIVVLSTQLLGLFGEEFTAGSMALIILATGQLVNISVGSTNYALAMTGHERSLAAAVGVSLIVNLAIGLILIPPYGILGAALTTSATLIVSNVMMVIFVKKYLGVWQLPFKYLSVWVRTVWKSR